tara:strand:+ start:620 stop:1342 length:723 start_codon:yes stop_codon:yes gene_type:complete
MISNEFYLLLVVVILFSSIQSILGIGLLLFGTPLLLIIGYSYVELLWILLPSSCSLSLYQIFENHRLIKSKKEIFYYTIPALILSLIIVLNYDYILDIKKIVGLFLLAISILRLFNVSKKWTKSIVIKSKNVIYLLIGLVHGFSNLGGAPLTILKSSLYNDSKKISTNIAFAYLILASSQLVILYSYKSEFFVFSYLLFIPIVILNHMIIQKLLFGYFNNSNFKFLINVVIFIFGFICLL